MADTFILELDQNFADDSPILENGNYHITLAEPVIINDGDELSVRLASVNIQSEDPNILLVGDTTLTGTYSYYDVDFDETNKVTYDAGAKGVAWPAATYEKYASYASLTIKEYSALTIKIPGWTAATYFVGVYDNAELSLIDGPKVDVEFQAIVHYLDENLNGQTAYFSASMIETYPNPIVGNPTIDDVFTPFPPTLYYGGSAAQVAAKPKNQSVWPTGSPALAPGEFPLLPITVNSVYPIRAVEGSFKLVGTKGQWPGAWKGTPTGQNAGIPQFPGTPVLLLGESIDGAVYPGALPPGTDLLTRGIAYSTSGSTSVDDTAVLNNYIQSVYDSRIVRGSFYYTDSAPISVDKFQLGQEIVSSTIRTEVNLKVNNFAVTIPAGNYTREAFAKRVTGILTDASAAGSQNEVLATNTGVNQTYTPASQLFIRMDAAPFTNIFFRKIDFPNPVVGNIAFDTSDSYWYYDTANNRGAPVFVGASVIALEYGQTGDVFQLSYAHTPMQDSLASSSPASGNCVAVFRTGTVALNTMRFFPVKTASGIVIHQLGPADIWDDKLGLADKLVVSLKTDGAGVRYYLKEEMEQKIPEGYYPLNNFPANPTAVPATLSGFRTQSLLATLEPEFDTLPANENIHFFESPTTKAIVGDPLSENKQGGLLLVEVLGTFRPQGGYIDTIGNKRQISAIISTENQVNNIVTGYADSGIPYQHKGVPYLITEARVRIISPRTKDIVKNLGPNNSVYIQIDRQPQRPPTEGNLSHARTKEAISQNARG
jgi:hypothetical protein